MYIAFYIHIYIYIYIYTCYKNCFPAHWPRVLHICGGLSGTVDQLALLRDLVAGYSDVFTLDMFELRLTDLVSHTINTGNNRPIWQPVR